MIVLNPPVFDHVVALDGENIKCQVVDMGNCTMQIGDTSRNFNILEAVPASANIVNIDYTFNIGAASPAKGNGRPFVNGGRLWVFQILYIPATPAIQIQALELASTPLPVAVQFNSLRIFIWYV